MHPTEIVSSTFKWKIQMFIWKQFIQTELGQKSYEAINGNGQENFLQGHFS